MEERKTQVAKVEGNPKLQPIGGEPKAGMEHKVVGEVDMEEHRGTSGGAITVTLVPIPLITAGPRDPQGRLQRRIGERRNPTE